MVNYYCQPYPTSTIDIKPLAILTLDKVKHKQTHEAQGTFNKIKDLLLHDTLLIFPDFEKLFYLHVNTSKTQLDKTIY